MKVNYNWLKEYLDGKLPEPKELGTFLDDHSYEVEGIETAPAGNAVLDISILPNRAADSLSHRGVAKEISAVLQIPFKDREVPQIEEIDSTLSVEILEDKKCPRYIGKKINNIEIKESPDGLREKLESLGQKSINNVVDSLNYIMFDVGQPMHAFDADKVAGKIIVRNAEEGEKITTLDNKEIELKKEDLVIADSEKLLAIAGVKGGKIAEVGASTKNIILEAANFNQSAVRHTSRRLGLITDASKRFESGVAPEMADIAMVHAAGMIKEIAGNDKTKIEESNDVYLRPRKEYKVGISSSEVNKLLGTTLEDSELEKIINRFSFEYVKVIPREHLEKLIPVALDKPYDRLASTLNDAPLKFSCGSLVNWLLKECGYPTPRVAIDMYFFSKHVEKDELVFGDFVFTNTGIQNPKDKMIFSKELGKEIPDKPVYTKTLEFMPGLEFERGIDHVGMYIGNGKVLHTSSNIGHSVIEDLDKSDAFKNECWFGRMVADLSIPQFVITIPFERLDLRIKEDLIEEVGRIYGLNNIKPVLPENISQKPAVNKSLYWREKIKDILVNAGFDEVYTYSFASKGDVELLNPISKELPYMRPDLSEGLSKSVRLNIKNKPILAIENVRIFEIGKVFKDKQEYLELGVALLKDDEQYLSLLEKTLSEELGVKVSFSRQGFNVIRVIMDKLNIDNLIEKLPVPEKYDWQNVKITSLFQSISNYPFVLRDIAAWVPAEEGKEALLEIIKTKSGDLLKRADLFDSFEKEGRVSYAYHLVFQSPERTLTDEEINGIMEEIYTEAKSRNFEIR